MIRRTLSLLGLSLLLSAAAHAGCTFELTRTGGPGLTSATISWSPVAGAAGYRILEAIEETGSGFQPVNADIDLSAPSFTATHVATVERNYDYIVMAIDANGKDLGCVGTTKIALRGDDQLRTATHKRVVPLVGSSAGANGALFKTSLTLYRIPLTKGKVYFRPAGTVASDNDPHLAYEFGDNGDANAVLHWDDVVAAMGATGVGTLEIIPDRQTRQAVPEVEARVYNVMPDGSTFGSREEAVLPSDYISIPWNQQRALGITAKTNYANFRRNIGFRTITAVSYHAAVQRPGEQPRIEIDGSAPAAYTEFKSVDAFIGQHVNDDEEVVVTFYYGAGDRMYVIPFYTQTDNSTNDPTVVVGSPYRDPIELGWVE